MVTVTQTPELIPSSHSQPLLSEDDLVLGDYLERQVVARKAAEEEAARVFIAEYTRRMNAPVFPQFSNAGEFFAYIIDQGTKRMRLEEDKEFTLNQFSLYEYQQLASYFMQDRATFGCKLDFRKGLLVFGAYGVGKSWMMRLFANNPRQSYRVVSARFIAEDFRLNGTIYQYQHVFLNDSSGKFFGQREIGLCIDEAGAESERASYGNRSNVIAELIQDRYENRQLRGTMTHIVTNHTRDELKNAYGPRVYDRLRQMFNVIEFDPDAPSRR
ncbi:hypothetical protein [Arsenicibacter rosenii]|uniref:hypothetical protein n=1 Tax=Arsenicibacter rosenii TaxID=1750698 RepID=UPI0011609374|nr:hypothetical protein [Arsenicibacter rosenii]